MKIQAAKKKFNQTHSKNWLSAMKFAEERRKHALVSINCDLYHYAANNPVKYTDPDGKKVFNKSNEYALIRTEDSGYVILTPNSTYDGKNVENYDYKSKTVTVIDMGKIDGVIKSSGDILKVTVSQETSLKFGSF